MSQRPSQRMKRCKSMTDILEETNRKGSSKSRVLKTSNSKKLYMGRRSLGVAAAGSSGKIKRKKSKTERDIDMDRYEYDYGLDDEGYAPSSSESSFRCIQSLDKSANSSYNHLREAEHKEPCTYASASLSANFDALTLNDRCALNRELTNFLKKEARERTQQLEMTQRVMDCALFGTTLRFIVGDENEKKYSFESILWLVLKAYESGRDVLIGKDQWMAEDQKIADERKKCMMVLDNIAEFRHEPSEKEQTDSLCKGIEFTPDYFAELRNVWNRVSTILERFDRLVTLFPHQNALWAVVEHDRGAVQRKMIEERLTAMRVWLNTVNDICDKFERLGNLFDVNAMPGGVKSWFRPLHEDNAVSSIEEIQPVFGIYVKKSLNLKGMKRVLSRVESLIGTTVAKTVILMQKPPESYAAAAMASTKCQLPISDAFKERYADMENWRFCTPTYRALGLPKPAKLFFFLLAIPMQLVIKWLNVRSEAQPPSEQALDELTIDAMITDSRDCVEVALRIKKNYMTILQALCSKCAVPAYLYPNDFDSNVRAVFQKYIHYIYCWTNCVVDQSDISNLFEMLEKEWSIALNCARSITSGGELLCTSLCNIIRLILRGMIEDFEEDEVDKFKDQFVQDDDDPFEEIYIGDRPRITPIQNFLRSINELIKEVKNRELRTFALIRTALNDLQDAVGYQLKDDVKISRLLLTMAEDFCLIKLNHAGDDGEECFEENLNVAIFIDKQTVDKGLVENCLLALSEGRKSDDSCIMILPDTQHNIGSIWSGRSTKVPIGEETRISFSNIRSDEILSICNAERLKILEGKYVNLLKEESLLKHLIRQHERIQMLIDKIVENYDPDDKPKRSLKTTLQKHFLITFQIHRDVARVISDSFMEKFGKEMIDIALTIFEKWMIFVTRFCSPASQLPMWAIPALNFLHSFSEPKWTCSSVMTDAQYSKLCELVARHKSAVIIEKDSVLAERLARPSHIMSRSTSSKSTTSSSLEKEKKQISKLMDIEILRDNQLRKNRDIGRVLNGDEEVSVLPRDDSTVRNIPAPFEYVIINEIATGGFGIVYRAMVTSQEPRVIAAKVISINKVLTNEINVFRQLSHNNLVKFYGFEMNTKSVTIFMEYCSEGTLEDICTNGMDLTMARKFTNSLLCAVQYLHDHKIIHRDIKPKNIFLDKKCVLKLGDFGCAARLRTNVTIFGEVRDVIGTVSYMAPEILSRGEMTNEEGVYKGYGRSVDIWAIGCTVIHMLSGVAPWKGMDMYQLTYKICLLQQKPPYPHGNREDVREFLDMCFEYLPDDRASASELLNTTFANVKPADERPIYENQSSKEDSFQLI
ncbi:unnamed protein product [Caenorhabditis bovis]|uniref:Protein kinase domain-containing protein n=1 Tax=Caenorhabditis bovis TaxID=2654633 RepID=A0A8S1F6N0_9PELO|nr:unnamed protein product [Caenorhabditis bovis]